MKGQIMTTPGNTNQAAAGHRPDTGPASQGGALVPAARYPVAGQPATTAGALRAAADLIERSAITGVSVTCSEGRIHIQVTGHCGDAPARAAVVARLAGYLGSATAIQEDSQGDGYSCIAASGSAGGLPVGVFTPLTVQHAGTGPDGQRLLLAAAPGGRIAQVAPPHHLPAGYRWLTDLDPSPPAAISGATGHAVEIASRDCPQPVTGAALRASAVTAPGRALPSPRSTTGVTRLLRSSGRQD